MNSSDEKTGATITVRIQKTYLHDGAILRIPPNRPSYLSSLTTSRESPELCLLKSALNYSITDLLSIQTRNSIILMILLGN